MEKRFVYLEKLVGSILQEKNADDAQDRSQAVNDSGQSLSENEEEATVQIGIECVGGCVSDGAADDTVEIMWHSVPSENAPIIPALPSQFLQHWYLKYVANFV